MLKVKRIRNPLCGKLKCIAQFPRNFEFSSHMLFHKSAPFAFWPMHFIFSRCDRCRMAMLSVWPAASERNFLNSIHNALQSLLQCDRNPRTSAQVLHRGLAAPPTQQSAEVHAFIFVAHFAHVFVWPTNVIQSFLRSTFDDELPGHIDMLGGPCSVGLPL